MKFFEKVFFWLRAARLYTVATSVVPYLFAVFLASQKVDVNVFLSILGFIGVVLAHLSINLLDDYFDWKKGAVEEYKKLLEAGMQARTHKCFYLEDGSVTLNQLLAAIVTMDFIACVCGFIIFLKVGWSVVLIAALAGFLAFFYSASPFKWSYRGLGEPVIGVIFGPLIMFGAYITAGAKIDNIIVLSSIIVGILIANIAYTHAIMDFDSDVKVGKKSFPIRFGSKENAINFLGVFYLLAYFLVLVGIILKIYPLISLIVFITLPKALALVKLMNSSEKTPKFWMGIMENWAALQKEGSDWFMMRLCLSRNLVVDFVILLAVSLCYNSIQ